MYKIKTALKRYHYLTKRVHGMSKVFQAIFVAEFGLKDLIYDKLLPFSLQIQIDLVDFPKES